MKLGIVVYTCSEASNFVKIDSASHACITCKKRAFTLNTHILLTDSAEIRYIGDLQVMRSSNIEFHENRCSESHALVWGTH